VMKENIKLLVARRRNMQKREGNTFLLELSKTTNIPLSEYNLLDPQYSFELEQAVNQVTREGFQSGVITKMRHMSIDELSKMLSRADFVLKHSEDEVDLLLCNYEDFSIRCKLGIILEALKKLITFDQDTLMIVHRKGQNGMMVDIETETVGSNCYELD
jgi:hypothetical protein